MKRQDWETCNFVAQKIGSHWDNPANAHPTLNQSNNIGGIGQSNQELFSQRGSGIVPAIALQTDVTPKASVELAFTLKLPSSSGGGQPAATMTPDMAVRRLTPVECERLQGFPDGHTLVGYRGKPVANGHRYKALGNSMAVPCMAWIGHRIAAQLLQHANDNQPASDEATA